MLIVETLENAGEQKKKFKVIFNTMVWSFI